MRLHVFPITALLLFLASCSLKQLQLTERSSSFVVVDSTQGSDEALAALLVPYRQHMDSSMNGILGYLEVPMSKAQPESTMGNFMTDAQLAAARRLNPKTQAAVMNYGGIRISYVSPGPLTKGKIFELMPFDNKLVIMEVPGKVLQQFCDHMAAYGGWPVAGLQFYIKDKKATRIYVGGKALNEQMMYTIAVSDYIADGGDQCDFLQGNKRIDYNVFIRDILMDYIAGLQAEGRSLHPQLENRIRYAE